MKSYRTTISALISVAGQFVLFASAPPYNIHYPIWVSAMAAFMSLGGLAALGINARDNSAQVVHSDSITVKKEETEQ